MYLGDYRENVTYQGERIIVQGERAYDPHYRNTAIASHYGSGGDGYLNQETNLGIPHDAVHYTFASHSVPPGTVCRLSNADGTTILALATDTGPYIYDEVDARGNPIYTRHYDLSPAAAKALGFFEQGTAEITVEVDDALTRQYLAAHGLPHYTDKVNTMVALGINTQPAIITTQMVAEAVDQSTDALMQLAAPITTTFDAAAGRISQALA